MGFGASLPSCHEKPQHPARQAFHGTGNWLKSQDDRMQRPDGPTCLGRRRITRRGRRSRREDRHEHLASRICQQALAGRRTGAESGRDLPGRHGRQDGSTRRAGQAGQPPHQRPGDRAGTSGTSGTRAASQPGATREIGRPGSIPATNACCASARRTAVQPRARQACAASRRAATGAIRQPAGPSGLAGLPAAAQCHGLVR